MEREIKFRGKSIDTGEWIYGNLQVPGKPGVEYFMWDEELYQRAVYPETVGQYTGLKDKYGKEIYERDIVTIGLCTALVTWNEELATFALQFDFEDKVGRKSLGEWDDTIVISNIHDNPELMKGGSNEA